MRNGENRRERIGESLALVSYLSRSTDARVPRRFPTDRRASPKLQGPPERNCAYYAQNVKRHRSASILSDQWDRRTCESFSRLLPHAALRIRAETTRICCRALAGELAVIGSRVRVVNAVAGYFFDERCPGNQLTDTARCLSAHGRVLGYAGNPAVCLYAQSF